MIKLKPITTLDWSQKGYIQYPPCMRCGEPDKEPGGGLIGYRPWVICAKCYIEWLIGK